MKFRVVTADQALAKFHEQARYIAVDCQSPLNAKRWLERVFDAIDRLEMMPRRYPLSVEDEHRPFEVRRMRVDNYHILFNVDDAHATVWVLSGRHAARLPRRQDLPEDLPE